MKVQQVLRFDLDPSTISTRISRLIMILPLIKRHAFLHLMLQRIARAGFIRAFFINAFVVLGLSFEFFHEATFVEFVDVGVTEAVQVVWMETGRVQS